MPAQRFSRGKRIRWQDTVYEIGIRHEGNILALRDLTTGEEIAVEVAELTTALFNGALEFLVSDAKAAPHAPQNLDLAGYDEHQRQIAQYRLSVIEPLLKLRHKERSDKYLSQYIAALQQNQDVTQPRKLLNLLSVRSIRRWIKDYVESGNDIRVLIPNLTARGGKDKSRIDSEAEVLVEQVLKELYLQRTTITIDELVWELARQIRELNSQLPTVEQLKVPSRATVGRRIQALDIELKLEAKKGKYAARRLTTQYGEMVEPTVPLERLEIDHTLLDVLVIDPVDNLVLGRPTLTFCMDVATRLPVGYSISFDPPSYTTVMECLTRGILPKTELCRLYETKHDWPIYGIPYKLVTDNGREFIGKDLEDACRCLGILLEHMPVRTPQFKGTIERHLGTISRILIHAIPGTTFSNVKDKGDYDSVQEACITLDDLDKALCLFLVDVYPFTFHRGIGTTPYSRFQALTKDGFMPRLPQSKDDLLVLLGRVEERTIQPYGIEFEGLRYNGPNLSGLRQHAKGKKVRFKYDPRDISRIHVLDERVPTYLEVPAVSQKYAAGLSLWKHQVILRFARAEYEKVDMAALGESMHRIRGFVEDGRARQKKVAGKRVARWGRETIAPELPPEPVAALPDSLPSLASGEDDTEDIPDWLKAADQMEWPVEYTLPTNEDRRQFYATKEDDDDRDD